jgi:hypothetical protein
MNYFLVPADPNNLWKTIRNKVDCPSWNNIRGYVPDHYARLKKTLGSETVHCWAVTKGREKLYKDMQSGDVVLLSEKGTNCFTDFGRIAYKVHCKELGDSLWPYVPAGCWEYIYFLKDVKLLATEKGVIDKRLILNELEFSFNYDLPGIIDVSKRVPPLIKKYGSMEDFLNAVRGKTTAPPKPIGAEILEVKKAPLSRTVIIPLELKQLLERIESLKLEKQHSERDHESLVEEFYRINGYDQKAEIKYRQGHVDIMIRKQGAPYIVNEVKKDWRLYRHDDAALKQAFGYALQHGARYVVITNGDYYARFDQDRKGRGFEDHFEFELTLSALKQEDLKNLKTFRKK